MERPVSTALTSPEGTPLAAIVTQRRTESEARFGSGFLLLDGPQVAYGSRLALAEAAQKTLDLQYYAIHADASTERLLGAVVRAARRGVRVRVLLDDFHSTGRNALVMRLAFQPNIEMRMFNPVAGARGSSLVRMFNAAGDFDRVQQRMHNKLFVADNAMGVTGGRNLGDAYFGIAEGRNFVDLDVLAAGPIVQDMSRSFDHYWNDERAYPVASLIDRETLQKLHDKTRTADAAQREHDNAPGDPNAPKPPDGEPRPTDAGPTDAQRAAAWDEQPLDLRKARFVWAPAALLADRPAKIAAESNEPAVAGAADLSATAPTLPRHVTVAGRLTESEDASGAADGGETVISGLLQLIGQARTDLTIISPYFVPGPDMKQAFAGARARGVRVRVLTNSLASNDAPIAHVGYARHRKELLAMGVELYELRSEQAGLGSAFGSSGASTAGTSRSMLHSKALAMDGQLLVIGSMNLDLRSQLQNTEIALLIRSRELSRMATAQIETAMRKAAWHVERSEGGLIWRAPEGSTLQDTRTEPDTSAGLRLLLKIFGPLAPDELL